MISAPRAAVQQSLLGDVTAARIVPIIVVATTLALWPALATLARFWYEMHDYQHGFLIADIAAAWLHINCRELRQSSAEPSWRAFGALAVVLVAWLIAWRASSQMLIQVLWPVALILAVWASAGVAAVRVVWMPIGYLYLAIPLWDYLVPMLQTLTVSVAGGALGWIGVPVYVDGSVVTIPEGTFAIIEGCAGKRYLMMAVAVAVPLGILEHLGARRLALLTVASALLAIVMNWIRVITVILAGHLSNMQSYLVAVEHFSYGWILFAVLVGLILWIGRGLAPAAVTRAPMPSVSDVSLRRADGDVRLRRWLVLPLLAAVVAAIGWAAPRPAAGPKLPPLPDLGSDWRGPVPADFSWQPYYFGASSEVRGAYLSAAGRVEVYANAFGPQTFGHKLVQLGHSVLGSFEWRVVGGPGPGAAIGDLVHSKLRFLRVRSASGDQWEVAYRYRVGAFATASDALAQLLYGAQALVHELPAGVVAVAARCGGDCGRTADMLQQFTAASFDRIDALIPRDIIPYGPLPSS